MPTTPFYAILWVPDSGIPSPNHQVHFQDPHDLMCAPNLLREDPMASSTTLSQEGAGQLFVGRVGGACQALEDLAFVCKAPHSARKSGMERERGGTMLRDRFLDDSRAQKEI